MERNRRLLWLAFDCLLFLSASAHESSPSNEEVTNNPADQLISLLNNNRTSHHLQSLYSNPGLACLALQYIKTHQGNNNCDAVGSSDSKKPADSEFTDTFAPNCDVESSSLAKITGRFIGCRPKYVLPEDALSEILMKNSESLEILYSKNHTEIGAAVSGTGNGGPFFWCVLFSNGKIDDSFVLEGGVAKIIRPGCFSGANDDCNGANSGFGDCNFWSGIVGWVLVAIWMMREI